MATLSLTLLWPPASGLFRFGPLHVGDLSLTLAAGVCVLGALELSKLFWRPRAGRTIEVATTAEVSRLPAGRYDRDERVDCDRRPIATAAA